MKNYLLILGLCLSLAQSTLVSCPCESSGSNNQPYFLEDADDNDTDNNNNDTDNDNDQE